MASLYDSASLVMIPSGVKDGKAYSIKPTDGSGDFTFSRGTDTATRVNASGLIEKERANQILQSNTFDTTWLNQLSGTITGGQSGYDGSSDAWLISKDTGTFRSVRQVISFSDVVTFSVYAKSGSLTDAALRFDTGAGAIQVVYDLTDGSSTLTGGAAFAHGTEDIGGGWYRLYMTADVTGGTNIHIYADRDGTTAGNIYIQDAQINQGLVAQPYIETTTAAVYEGITDNLPRLDYSGGASCPSLLLEPQRRNLVTSSEYSSTLTGVTASYVDSPEGLNNATRLTEDTATSQHYAVFNVSSIISGNTYAISFYVREGSTTSIQVYTQSSIINNVASISFSSETISVGGAVAGSPFMTSVGNGWYRCGWVGTALGTSSMAIYAPVVNLNSSVGDGTSYIDYYGFQVEDNGAGGGTSYPTSYIPTYGAIASRAGDNCVKTGISSLVSASEYTIFWEGSNIPTGEYNSFATIYNNSEVNQSARFYRNNTDNQIFAAAFTSGGQVTLASGITAEYAKCAFRVKSGDFALYVNGSLVASSTSTMIPSASLDSVNVQYFNSGQSFEQKTKQLLFFKSALTNAELAALTTI